MKQINKEDMKLGEFIYVIDKDRKRERAFMVEIIKFSNRFNVNWWKLKEKSKYLFELKVIKWGDDTQGNCNLTSEDWENYNLFKLNKKETENFKRNLILKNL